MQGNEITVALGYQFRSSAYSDKNLIAAINHACSLTEARLRRAHHNIVIKTHHLCSEIGKPLSTQIVEMFTAADIGIFEISDVNPNVMYEAGLLTGRRLYPILIRNESRSKIPPPSDIRGVLALNYKNTSKLAVQLVPHLIERVEQLLNGREPFNEWLNPFRTVWLGANRTDGVATVVCGHVPRSESRKLKYPDLVSVIHNFTDRDSLIEVTKTLAVLYPQLEQYKCTSKTLMFESDRIGNIISLGGPEFNSFYGQMSSELRLPFVFKSRKNNDAWLIDTRSRKSFRSVRKDHVPVKDYGIFCRISNPIDNTSHIVLCSGITTLGVLAAVKAFAPEEQYRHNSTRMLDEVHTPYHFAVIVVAKLFFGRQYRFEVDWSTKVVFE